MNSLIFFVRMILIFFFPPGKSSFFFFASAVFSVAMHFFCFSGKNRWNEGEGGGGIVVRSLYFSPNFFTLFFFSFAVAWNFFHHTLPLDSIKEEKKEKISVGIFFLLRTIFPPLPLHPSTIQVFFPIRILYLIPDYLSNYWF